MVFTFLRNRFEILWENDGLIICLCIRFSPSTNHLDVIREMPELRRCVCLLERYSFRLSTKSFWCVSNTFWFDSIVCAFVSSNRGPLASYIYIYIYVTHIYIYIYNTHTHISLSLSLCIYLCIYIYTYTHVSTYVYTQYVCIHLYIYTHDICIYIYIYTSCVYISMCIYIYI